MRVRTAGGIGNGRIGGRGRRCSYSSWMRLRFEEREIDALRVRVSVGFRRSNSGGGGRARCSGGRRGRGGSIVVRITSLAATFPRHVVHDLRIGLGPMAPHGFRVLALVGLRGAAENGGDTQAGVGDGSRAVSRRRSTLRRGGRSRLRQRKQARGVEIRSDRRGSGGRRGCSCRRIGLRPATRQRRMSGCHDGRVSVLVAEVEHKLLLLSLLLPLVGRRGLGRRGAVVRGD